MQENAFGFAHLWASGDIVSHTIAIVLALMSITSWYLILAKAADWFQMRQAARKLDDFWAARSFGEGVERLASKGGTNPFVQLAEQADHCNLQCETASDQLSARFDPAEQMERNLRQQLSGTQAELESGLTLLATTGATAPFVGLFGTVWGIYHALVAIGISGQAALEKVAGPVGEALIMTAAGLAVALPAVFAYNAVARANRVILASLDAFAHDLHAFFTLGKRIASPGAQAGSTLSRLKPNTAKAA